MNINQFAESRGESRQAVSMYIQRHPEMFEGHISYVGKSAILDEIAMEHLEKKYPLKAEIVNPDEDYKALSKDYRDLVKANQELVKENIKLHKQIEEIQKELVSGQAAQLMLDDTRANYERLLKNAESWSEIYEQKTEQIMELREELLIEKNKSWWDRLWKK